MNKKEVSLPPRIWKRFSGFHISVLFTFLSVFDQSGVQLRAQNLTNGLASQWVADDYVSGNSWADRINGTVAVVDGAPAPVAVANTFGIHNGVQRNTGTTGNGGFLIPTGNPPTGFTNYTIAVVFQAAAGGPSGSSYYSDDIIFGYDIAGAGQPDWGISWGGSSSLVGQGVVAGIGRAGGDSGLQTVSNPLALNATHAAVFQINGGSGTESLFEDGVQVGQNTGLTILSPTNYNGNGKIPMLSSMNSTIATAFIGLLAEVRVYTNATVSGTALSAYLQNYYTKIPQITLTASPASTNVGGMVILQVSIPATLSQTGPFTVTLTSSNPAVVSSTNVVFSTGATSTNVSLLVNTAGTASVTASGAGVLTSLPVTITGYPVGAQIPVVWFKADAITGVTNGGALAAWTDSTGNGYNATQGTLSQEPTYVTNAMNSLPVVRFNTTNSTSLSFTRPVQDDFTIICVFQSTQGLYSGSLYYQGAGLVNGEVAGVINDFGTCLFANGAISAGTGNPDVAVASGAGYNDGNPHIFTFTRTRSTGLVSLYVDGSLVGTTTGGTQSLTSPAVLVLGAQQTLINFLTGDIAEVQVFNTALFGTKQQAAEAPLFAKYNLPTPAPTGLFLQLQNRQIILNWLPANGATNYVILRATAAGGPYTVVGTNATTTFIDTTVSPNIVYYYEVAAVNGTGKTGADSVAVGTDTIASRHEPLGPSSRTTPIAISEIMWKPAARADGKNLEFLELYNSNPWFQNIGGYTLTCADMNYTIPANTIIASNSFIIIAAAPADMESVYGLTNVLGPYSGSLKHSETLQLLDEQTNVLLTVPYDNTYPWPVATGGTGHSLILSNPSYGEGDPRAWDISTFAGGSPGAADVYPASLFGNVVINEILPHSENPAVPQFVELYNHGGTTNDVSGCILTDDPTTNKFVIPSGTVLGPAGFVSFTQPQFGFTLNGAGETLYLISPDGTRILDAVQFGAQANGVSFGRWPDGANDFYALTTNTPGTNNSLIVIGDIVINELMYDPISGNDADQYIELYNKGTNTINLAGWQFTSGVAFTFPSITMSPNGYLVVAENMTNLFAEYTNLNRGNTVGNYTGKLSHKGELVTLSMPQTLYTNTAILVEEDQVAYGTGGRWGEWAGGGGSSLELKDPRSNHRLASNWADSDESQKSSWTNIQFTGALDNGFNFDPFIDFAEIGILDTGECLVDNVVVKDTNGVNYVSNSTFESGTNDWTFLGDHIRSSLENSGYQSSHSLHLRASDHYYNGDDCCEVALNTNTFMAGQTATMGFEARWIHGWPEVVLRLSGGWLEATGPLPIPTNLGTPGMPNSQFVTNAGPAIYNVAHSPAVPAASQPTVVSVQVHDPNRVQNITLNYRIDPATTYTSVPLLDNGTGGDMVAGDGIFSATIPGQVAHTMVAYYISATDSLGATNRFPALLADNTPMRECLVMFGDGNPAGSFGVYHLWLTQSNVTRWANLGNESNEGIDATMVEANRVIYNMQGHYAGSPVHQYYDTPNGTLCSYKWIFNDDDKFLGATDFNKIHNPGNTGDDPTYQREQLANTFLRALGVPWLNRRDVVVYVNGNRRGEIMEDAQTPGSDYVKEYFPNDAQGYLYKLARWYEFGPFNTGYVMPNDEASEGMIMPYATTGGVKKIARYRWTFENRRTPDSENNYANVFSLIDAANSQGTPNYVRNMENMANMENWMRVFAANHAAGNWDSFGCSSGQNLYPYIGTLGTKWTLLMFDFNIGLGIDGSYPPGEDLFENSAGDANIAGIYNNPTFLRMMWRAYGELIANGPLNLSISVPLVNAKYAALTANGMTVEDPNLNLIPWLTQATPLVAAQVNAANATNFSVNASVTLSNNVAYLTGQAPFTVNTIVINGATYPLSWTSVTNWVIAVPLLTGTNQFNVVGFDRYGQPITGGSNSVSVVYNGTNVSPVGQIVLNEIMYAPSIDHAQFVELFNSSTNTTFDLSGWQLQGLGYSFPNGSTLAPTNYLVLAQNNAAFAAAYGATNPIFDLFSGTLPASGTLALETSSNVTVTEMVYENQLPWPTNAAGTGASLQLIDPHQDNWRVGNWLATPFSATPGALNSVAGALTPFPSLWINELQADNLTGITNNAGQHTGWLELYNPGTNIISLSGLYLANNYTNLLGWAFPTNASINPGQFKVIFADAQTNLSTTHELHASFILPSGSGSLALTRLATNGQPQVLDYVDYQNIYPNDSYGSLPDGQSFNRQEFFQATPGAANNGMATLPASFVDYLLPGSVYTQNFDALPDPGTTSVNANNPVTINGTIYSLANPYDFAFPAITSGGTGGLGLSALAGWFGSSVATAQFGATAGDQTTGGDLSFGLPGSANRALGLLATTSTKGTAFGVRFLNGTSTTLTRMNLQFTGEVWRQSNLPKTLQFYYFVDITGTKTFSTNMTALIPALNVNISTVAADTNGVAVDGTAAINQTNLSVLNQTITNWPPGAALWLVWQMTDSTGKAQGLGIDDLSFSASVPLPVPVTAQVAGTNVFLSWQGVAGQTYQLEYKNDLIDPVWTAVGNPVTGIGATLTLTNDSGTLPQRFFHIRLVN
jgi:hypothetical protein